MLWIWVLPTLWYSLPFYYKETFFSLAGQKQFRIRLTLVPHILVLCIATVRHNLVVYAGTVDLLVLLVFCDGNAVFLFLCTVAKKGGIFVLFNTNKMGAQCIFFLPVFRYLIVFFEYTYEVFGMLFALVFYSKVVNYQCEIDLPPFLFPLSWSELTVYISVFW